MYIVIVQPVHLNANFATSFTNPTVAYFNTKEQLTCYLKSASGNIRVFEATELDFNVNISLVEKNTDPEMRFTC